MISTKSLTAERTPETMPTQVSTFFGSSFRFCRVVRFLCFVVEITTFR